MSTISLVTRIRWGPQVIQDPSSPGSYRIFGACVAPGVVHSVNKKIYY